MKPADDREEVLFREALKRASGPARDAFLDGACVGNAALRARLEALLQAQESPDRDILFRAYKPSICAVASITLENESSGKGAIRWMILFPVIIDLWRWPKLLPGVRHQSLHRAGWSLRLGRGHHPPAACFRRHEVWLPLLRSADGDAAFFIGLDQNRLPVHARNLALCRLLCQAEK